MGNHKEQFGPDVARRAMWGHCSRGRCPSDAHISLLRHFEADRAPWEQH